MIYHIPKNQSRCAGTLKNSLKSLPLIIISYTIFLNIAFVGELRHNWIEDRFEFADGKDELIYNYIEDEWRYEREDAELEYNYIENRWEYD